MLTHRDSHFYLFILYIFIIWDTVQGFHSLNSWTMIKYKADLDNTRSAL
jgi:hypothetical protein